jgi:hypothetical protein
LHLAAPLCISCAGGRSKQTYSRLGREIVLNHTQGVITPQARIKETETELSDSEVLTLPGGFKPATPKSLD